MGDPIVNRPISGRANLSVSALATLGVLSCQITGCQDTRLIGLRYTFDGCPGSEVRSLQVSVSDASGGKASADYDSVPTNQGATLALHLPSSLQGESRFDLTGKDAEGCVVARGNTTADLSMKRDAKDPSQDIVAALQCLPSKECGSPDPTLDPNRAPTHRWSLRCGSNNNDLGSSVAFDTIGNVFVTGSFGGDTINCKFLGAKDPKNELNRLANGSFLIKLSADGEVLWGRRLGGLNQMAQPSVFFPRATVDEDGNAFIWGSVDGVGPTLEGAPASLASNQYFIAKYSADGVFNWQQTSPYKIQAISARKVSGRPTVLIGGFGGPGEVVPGKSCGPASAAFMLQYDDDTAAGLQTPKNPVIACFEGADCVVTRASLTAQGSTWTAYCSRGAKWLNDTTYSTSVVSFMSHLNATLTPQSHSDLVGEPSSVSFVTVTPQVPPMYALSAAVDSSGQAFMIGPSRPGVRDAALKLFPSKSSTSTASSNFSQIDPAAVPGFVEFDHDQHPLVAGQIDRGRSYDLFVTKYRNGFATDQTSFWPRSLVFVTGETQHPMGFASDRGRNRFAIVSRTALDPFDASPDKPGMKLLPRARNGGTTAELLLVVMEPTP